VLAWAREASEPAATPRGWAGAAEEEQVTYRVVRVQKNTITVRITHGEPVNVRLR
jgi:hypothetical protein